MGARLVGGGALRRTARRQARLQAVNEWSPVTPMVLKRVRQLGLGILPVPTGERKAPYSHASVTFGPTLYPTLARYALQSGAVADAGEAATKGTTPTVATTLNAARARLNFMYCPSRFTCREVVGLAVIKKITRSGSHTSERPQPGLIPARTHGGGGRGGARGPPPPAQQK